MKSPLTTKLKTEIITIDPTMIFNLLSDATRLRCLSLLQQEGELCVCELMHALDMIQPKVSRHLALLRKHNLVADRRAGLWVYYRLNRYLPEWMQQVIQISTGALNVQEPYQTDRWRLARMLNRPQACKPCC